MSYYIGLSILSNNDNQKFRKRIEARRILSLFENRPVEENDIAREEQGRPFFPDREVDFNISHSGGIIAVSYINGKGLRVGCDVERIRRRSSAEKIAQDYFSSAENEYIFAEKIFDETRFYEIWTLKESYLKLRGLGIFDMKQAPSFIKKNQLAICGAVSRPLSIRLFELSNEKWGRCILSTIIEGDIIESQIRWFSSASLVIDRVIDMK